MPIPAFQPNAFQFGRYGGGFQTQTRIPVIIDPECRPTYSFEVVIPVQAYRAGAEVYIKVKVRDSRQVPEQLFNPVDGVTITIRGPDEVAVVTDGAMTNEAVGEFSYRYQTDASDDKGGYTIEPRSDNNGSIGQTLPMLAFVLQ
jgi:uncharacterized protein YfaS (alpha-2-macroglobulin family)